LALLAVYCGNAATHQAIGPTVLENPKPEDVELLTDLLDSLGILILANGEPFQEVAPAILELLAPIVLQEAFSPAFDAAAEVFLGLRSEVSAEIVAGILGLL
jgi:hypothetical protein